jgi:thymidylate synthase (FAD)
MKPPKLVAITQPLVLREDNVTLITPEEFIAYAARISNPSNQMNTETSAKLLTYLVKNSHWSPFDMVDMIVEVETSKAIAIQMLRHWSFRFQEFSQRYAEVSELNFDHVEARNKAVGGNRQGSGHVSDTATEMLQKGCASSAGFYQTAIDAGIAPESARMVLPMATLSTLYVKGSVRSWMTYFWQRLDPHAQKEHRELAQGIYQIFCEHFPVIAELVRTHKPQVIEMEGWMA